MDRTKEMFVAVQNWHLWPLQFHALASSLFEGFFAVLANPLRTDASLMPSLAAIAFCVSPAFLNRRMAWSSRFIGRPSFWPRARAFASPAFTRILMTSASNCANAAIIWSMRRPWLVERSNESLRLANSTPTSARSCSIEMISRNDLPQRSNFHTNTKSNSRLWASLKSRFSCGLLLFVPLKPSSTYSPMTCQPRSSAYWRNSLNCISTFCSAVEHLAYKPIRFGLFIVNHLRQKSMHYLCRVWTRLQVAYQSTLQNMFTLMSARPEAQKKNEVVSETHRPFSLSTDFPKKDRGWDGGRGRDDKAAVSSEINRTVNFFPLTNYCKKLFFSRGGFKMKENKNSVSFDKTVLTPLSPKPSRWHWLTRFKKHKIYLLTLFHLGDF